MSKPPIRFAVLDDHPMVGEGIRRVLECHDDLRCTGMATTADAAEKLVLSGKPDVLLLDIRLNGADGVVLCRRLRARFPDLTVLIVTSFADSDIVRQSLEAGAAGVALKSISMDMLPAALRQVSRGERYLCSELVSQSLAETSTHSSTGTHSAGARPASGFTPTLTPREREVVALVARGQTNKEIARALSISAHTVKLHISRVLRRYGFRRRAQLVPLAERSCGAVTGGGDQWRSSRMNG